jgi:hypothetical protein
MSEKNNPLELYIAEKLKSVDPTARPTKGSGCGNELGDIYSELFWAECKQKHTHANIIMDLKEDFLKLARKVPVDSLKEIFVVIENKFGDKFVVMESEAFFRLVELAHGEE